MRPAVVNRKVWGGNRTDKGAHSLEVLATVLRTAVQQGLDMVDIVTELLQSPTPRVASMRFAFSRPPPG